MAGSMGRERQVKRLARAVVSRGRLGMSREGKARRKLLSATCGPWPPASHLAVAVEIAFCSAGVVAQ